MFDHDRYREILELLRSISYDQLHLRGIIMADLQAVKDAQATETQAIVDLAARVAALPQPAATASDLDGLVSTAQANTAAVQAIAPTA